jgi:hypothetical protein
MKALEQFNYEPTRFDGRLAEVSHDSVVFALNSKPARR